MSGAYHNTIHNSHMLWTLSSTGSRPWSSALVLIKKMLGSLPSNVVYVSVDFNKEKLDERLLQNGYDQDKQSLFIWDAVTAYLAAEAVDQTLGFVAQNSGPGSCIII
jgi:methyltransferase (TIGR00027 family)